MACRIFPILNGSLISVDDSRIDPQNPSCLANQSSTVAKIALNSRDPLSFFDRRQRIGAMEIHRRHSINKIRIVDSLQVHFVRIKPISSWFTWNITEITP